MILVIIAAIFVTVFMLVMSIKHFMQKLYISAALYFGLFLYYLVSAYWVFG